jgi:hypothetical protein
LGCVGYVGPEREREDIFDASWSIIRMLSMDPAARGTLGTFPAEMDFPMRCIPWLFNRTCLTSSILHMLEEISVRRLLTDSTADKWKRKQHEYAVIAQVNQHSAAGN